VFPPADLLPVTLIILLDAKVPLFIHCTRVLLSGHRAWGEGVESGFGEAGKKSMTFIDEIYLNKFDLLK
jgi:hypothetical protein